MNIFKLIICFFFYGACGWVVEELFYLLATKKIVPRGFLHGPLCPIYGAGSLGMVMLGTPFADNIPLLFCIGMFFTTLIEYITSVVLERLFNSHWWDYSGFIFNIKGRVCLPFSIGFGIMTVLVVKFIHPLVESIIFLIPEYDEIYIAWAFISITLIDIIVTVWEMNHLTINEIMKKTLLRFSFKYLDNHYFTIENHKFFYKESVYEKLEPWQKKYLEIAKKREESTLETEQIVCAFPILNSENAKKWFDDVKKRIPYFYE